MGKYRNILYEDIKKEDPSIRDILYLLFEKESDYNNLVTKRTKLLKLINQNTYPKTYNTLISQDALIDKQHSILDDIFILENNIKIEEDKISKIEDEAMVVPILKILYEFWITNSYDPKKVDKTKIFIDNKNFITLKNNIDKEDNTSKKEASTKIQKTKSNIETISNLNLPGINEDNLVNINGKDYIKSDN